MCNARISISIMFLHTTFPGSSPPKSSFSTLDQLFRISFPVSACLRVICCTVIGCKTGGRVLTQGEAFEKCAATMQLQSLAACSRHLTALQTDKYRIKRRNAVATINGSRKELEGAILKTNASCYTSSKASLG